MTQVSASRKEGIWIIDAEGHTVFSNDAMAELLGTTVTELRGKDSFSYLFPEDVPEAGFPRSRF